MVHLLTCRSCRLFHFVFVYYRVYHISYHFPYSYSKLLKKDYNQQKNILLKTGMTITLSTCTIWPPCKNPALICDTGRPPAKMASLDQFFDKTEKMIEQVRPISLEIHPDAPINHPASDPFDPLELDAPLEILRFELTHQSFHGRPHFAHLLVLPGLQRLVTLVEPPSSIVNNIP